MYRGGAKNHSEKKRSCLSKLKSGFLFYSTNSAHLHSNQSSIEAIFSFVRSLLRDNAGNFAKAMTTSNMLYNAKMASEKSTGYSNDDIGNENEMLKKAPFDAKTGPKRREEWLS
jgi:hypothetical protein